MNETVKALKGGSHEMFLSVLKLYHIKAFRFFYKKINDVEDAKELTQQCFIRVWEYRKLLSKEYSIERQIFAIANSIWLNHVKKTSKQQKMKSHYLQENQQNEIRNVIIGNKPFEEADFMNAAFDCLSPIQQQILHLKFSDGFTNKEISQRLSISIKTVEWHINRAYSQLREIVHVI